MCHKLGAGKKKFGNTVGKAKGLTALAESLKVAVGSGELSEEDAWAKYQEADGAGGEKGNKHKSNKK